MNFKSYEINRKLVHLIALIIPIMYYFTNKTAAIIFISMLFLFFLLFDIVRIRYYGRYINIVNKLFLRPKELYKLSGGFYFTLSCLIGIVFFNKYIFIISSSILIICDTVAALIGMNFGKHKVFDKSIEGSLAFFISGVGVIMLVNTTFMLPLWNVSLLLALLLTTLGELISNKIKLNDNLLILLLFGVSYYLISHLV